MKNRKLALLLLLFMSPSALGNSLAEAFKARPASAAVLATGLAFATTTAARYQEYKRNLAWNWKEIGTDNIDQFSFDKDSFPAGFYFGAGNSAIQSEGGTSNSTYCHDCHKKSYPDLNGTTNDSWNRWNEDLALLKKLGLKAYRVSIEWSRIMPTPDTFDRTVLDEYARRIASLINAGITPFIGFHHYSDPQWFMYGDNHGGFEKENNGAYFVRYCTTAFEHFNNVINPMLQALPADQRAKLRPRWLTFNSPGSYALNGYYRAGRPPLKTDLQIAVNVYENMLKAHNSVYHAIKKIDDTAQIGITHNILHLDPNPKADYASWLKGSMAAWFGNWVSNSAGLNFFTDGRVTVSIPGKATKNMNPWQIAKSLANRWFFDKSQKTLDFICVNYYSHAYLDSFKDPQPATDELKSANPMYTVYAEGLYRAIKEAYDRVAKPLGIPIYITENGFSENIKEGKVAGDQRRMLFLNRHLYAISKAIKDGYPVMGYMYWCLYDNCEWDQGYNLNFGLADRERNIKPSGHHYAQLIKQQVAQ